MTKKITKALALIMAVICMLSVALTGSAANYIGVDAAKKAAVDAVNAKFVTTYTVEGVTFEDRTYVPEYEDDYGCTVYDIAFRVKNDDGTTTEYDLDIDAETGALKGQIETETEKTLLPSTGDVSNFFQYFINLINTLITYLKSLFNIG